MNETPRVKFILIGDSGTGKTCILFRFISDVFYENSSATIGVDVRVKEISWNNNNYKLALYDTAGQERFKSLTPIWYRGSHGVMLIYSITDRQSFLNVQDWLNEVRQHCKDNYVTMLVGNKNDLESERQVSTEEARVFAQENNLLFLEVSAKTHDNIDQAFEEVFNQIILNNEQLLASNRAASQQQSQKLDLVEDNSSSSSSYGGGCC